MSQLGVLLMLVGYLQTHGRRQRVVRSDGADDVRHVVNFHGHTQATANMVAVIGIRTSVVLVQKKEVV
jgi:hypothetical protein